jgi:hypothetical protein
MNPHSQVLRKQVMPGIKRTEYTQKSHVDSLVNLENTSTSALVGSSEKFKSSIMPSSSKKRKHKTKPPIQNMTSLYVEDVETESFKTTGIAPQPHIQTCRRVKVDKDEKTKRERRMVL